MAKAKQKLTPLILPDELIDKAKKLSVQILGKENISGIVRYLIIKEKLLELIIPALSYCLPILTWENIGSLQLILIILKNKFLMI